MWTSRSRALWALYAFAISISAALAVGADGGSETVADAAGHLHVPAEYRIRYQYLGTWAVAADDGPGSKELHVVYASPGSVAAFKATGHFPDGTVLVKEVFEATTAPMTTGTVSRPQTLKGWFVVVRDTKGQHPGNTLSGNTLWGDGWGWSWFDADKPTKTTSTDYRVDCQACHVPAKATDWMYTSGYPILKR